MNAQEKYDLITRNTQEVIGEDELKAILDKRDMKVYLGTAITGRPHVGYFVPAIKMADFLNAGCEVTLLLADLHALMDDLKTPFELLDHRYEYYKKVTTALMKAVGADVSKLKFVRGIDFENKPDYTLDLYKMAAIVSLNDAKRAAAEVVRFGDSPRLGGFLYPIMQALDEQYLGVDAQYGGVDQRKILMFARENLPKLGYKSRVEIMTPMIPGLSGGKMSSSEAKSKIDLIDDAETIKKKMNSAFCPECQIEDNGVLAFLKHVLMVLKTDAKEKFVIKRPEKWGGDLEYSTYEELEKDFVDKKVHPQDVKQSLAEEIIKLTESIREAMKDESALIKKAYPEA